MGVAHGRDQSLTVRRPDDDGVDLLLDEILHLADLARHVATGVENDDLDIGVGVRRSDEGLLIGRLIAVDADIVLRDADPYRVGRSSGREGQRAATGKQKAHRIGHGVPPEKVLWRPSPSALLIGTLASKGRVCSTGMLSLSTMEQHSRLIRNEYSSDHFGHF